MKQAQLSFWQICNVTVGFLGIQFGLGLQNANISRIFQTQGADVSQLPMLWIVAPLAGLILPPIIGYASDRTWGPWGRRKPYLMAGAILASLALLLIPYSSALWCTVGLLLLFNSATNMCMDPSRILVAEILPASQHTKGYATQSFFIAVGAVVASLLPYALTNWLHIDNVVDSGQLPDTVRWSFIVGAVVLLAAVAHTVFRTKEYSPTELAEFHEETERFDDQVDEAQQIPPFKKYGLVWLLIGLVICSGVFLLNLESNIYFLGVVALCFGMLHSISGRLQHSGRDNFVSHIMVDLYNMTPTMKRLAAVQFFSWLALFAMWIYTTAVVTSHTYKVTDVTSQLYNEGANWVGVLFAVYNGFAAIVALLLPRIARYIGRAKTHALSLLLGGIGLVSIFFIKDPLWLIMSMVLVGVSWASILSMPYAIVTATIPQKKLGTYMGVFNLFIVIPQIIASVALGPVCKYLFGGQVVYAIVLGGVSMIIAAALVYTVHEKK